MFSVSSGKTETRWHQTAQKSESIAKQWLIHRCSHWPPCSNSPFLNDPIQLMTPIYQWHIQSMTPTDSGNRWGRSFCQYVASIKTKHAFSCKVPMLICLNCTKTMSITWKNWISVGSHFPELPWFFSKNCTTTEFPTPTGIPDDY